MKTTEFIFIKALDETSLDEWVKYSQKYGVYKKLSPVPEYDAFPDQDRAYEYQGVGSRRAEAELLGRITKKSTFPVIY